jgi:hypothetical protein
MKYDENKERNIMKPVEKSLNKHSKIAAVAGESGNNLQRN